MKTFFFECWNLIEAAGKRKILFIALVTVSMNALDILAVGLIGVVGALAFRGIQGQGVGDRTLEILNFLKIGNFNLNEQIAVLGLLAFILLMIKSFLIYYFTKRVFLFMSFQSAHLSRNFIEFISRSSIQEVQSRSSQEYVFHISTGTANLMMGVIGNAFAIMSDCALFLFLFFFLLFVDFISATLSGFMFILLGFTLHRLMQGRAINLGRNMKNLNIANNERIQEFTSSFREIVARNTQDKYSEDIIQGKLRIVNVSALLKMMPLFSKYSMEIMVFATFLIVMFLQFIFNDTSRAFGNLALFLGATSRMSPAVLRIQQGLIQIKSAMGGGESTLRLLQNSVLRTPTPKKLFESSIRDSDFASHKKTDFLPRVVFKEVSFRYSLSSSVRIDSLSMVIEAYDFVALVGPTGAGKSTIVDLLFGLLNPTAGEVLINEVPAREALKYWPEQFGYVPQNVIIHKGTVMSNLLLGLERTTERELQAIELLKTVSLYDTIVQMNGGLDAVIDERGGNLSGGQRQRLGIARALMTNPKILVMDESTSSLDANSESLITESLLKLRDSMTLIVIAHRLSTVKSARRLFYVEDGKIISEGDFEVLRANVKDFDKQAKLMGL
jgi:ATP-binding cassette subfamily C protein